MVDNTDEMKEIQEDVQNELDELEITQREMEIIGFISQVQSEEVDKMMDIIQGRVQDKYGDEGLEVYKNLTTDITLEDLNCCDEESEEEGEDVTRL